MSVKTTQTGDHNTRSLSYGGVETIIERRGKDGWFHHQEDKLINLGSTLKKAAQAFRVAVDESLREKGTVATTVPPATLSQEKGSSELVAPNAVVGPRLSESLGEAPAKPPVATAMETALKSASEANGATKSQETASETNGVTKVKAKKPVVPKAKFLVGPVMERENPEGEDSPVIRSFAIMVNGQEAVRLERVAVRMTRPDYSKPNPEHGYKVVEAMEGLEHLSSEPFGIGASQSKTWVTKMIREAIKEGRFNPTTVTS